MNVVADIANAIRDGRLDEARAALLGREDRIYREIEGLVGSWSRTSRRAHGARSRDSVEAANRRSLVAHRVLRRGAVALALLVRVRHLVVVHRCRVRARPGLPEPGHRG